MKVFAVVRADGTIKRSRRSHHLFVYLSGSMARRQATADGDTVVEVDVDLNRTPLYIKGQVLGVS